MALIGWLLAPALAQEVEEIEVVEARPDEVRDRPETVTAVEVADLPQSADVATAVQRAPGTVVRRLGGLGDLAVVSIRGSSARQVEVYLDGVPLNPEGGSALDLSELPLRAFERVLVWRGGAPVAYGSTAVGGIVDLVPAEEPRAAASIGAGSWGTATGTWAAAGPTDVGELWLVAQGHVTGGAYPWYDDAGTRYDAADDRVRERENNDDRQLAVHGRWQSGDETLRISAWNAFLASDEGVPGFTFAPTEVVRYGIVRDLQVLGVDGASGGFRGQGRAWALVRSETLDDRRDEIGVGAQHVRDTTTSLGARLSGALAASAGVRLEGAAEGRADRFASADLLAGLEAPDRRRTVGKLGLALTAHPGPLAVAPAVQALHLVDAEGARGFVLPRLHLRWTISDALLLRAGAGRFARPPDLVELYGDRGALVGNEALRPEHGAQLDLGARLQAGPVEGELGGFAHRITDGIVWVQAAQGVARPENLALSEILGLEGALRLELPAALSTASTATVMRGVNRSEGYAGLALPRLPAVELLHLTAWSPGRLTLSHDLSYTSATFTDAANVGLQAPRLLHGATAAVRPAEGLSVELDVRNLLDHTVQEVPRDRIAGDLTPVPRPVEDVVGYPLPGRTLLLTVRVER